jgi:rhomboid family GlyGly-CTERM serine protease
MPRAGLRPSPRAWAGLSVGLALGALALWSVSRESLDWQPALAWSQPWRLWTAAFVHLSPLHLQANLLGCAVVAAFGIVARLPGRATWAWLAAWPLTHAALALQPSLLHYGGLSGLLHAGVAIAAWQLAWRAPRRSRLIGWAVFAGLVAKLVLERAWVGPTQAVAGWDFPVAPLAHLTGAVAGLLCAVFAQVIVRRPAPPLNR